MAISGPITSTANPRVKEWASLLDKKGRDKTGLYLVEGPHLVQEALASEAQVLVVVYAQEKGIPGELEHLVESTEWIPASDDCILKCSDTVHPQGIFAVVRKRNDSIESLLAMETGLAIVADGVQDPGNLGTIIRSADAAGADAVILGKGTVDLYNPKTVRSTMGSMFHLPIIEADLQKVLPQAKERGIRTLSASLQAKQSCYEYDFRQSTWLIMGNEANGVSASTRPWVTDEIIIPMQGQAESLNVAMASTVLLYEAMRQRHFSNNNNSSEST